MYSNCCGRVCMCLSWFVKILNSAWAFAWEAVPRNRIRHWALVQAPCCCTAEIARHPERCKLGPQSSKADPSSEMALPWHCHGILALPSRLGLSSTACAVVCLCMRLAAPGLCMGSSSPLRSAHGNVYYYEMQNKQTCVKLSKHWQICAKATKYETT